MYFIGVDMLRTKLYILNDIDEIGGDVASSFRLFVFQWEEFIIFYVN